MKQFVYSLVLFFFVSEAFAQLPVNRVPVYEVFSSSTCPPCKPANDYLTPLFEQYKGEIAVVKYQMSWPGTGDPYYTAEANTRRGVYSVNSVPALFRNANSLNPTSLDSSKINTDLDDMVYMDIQLRYFIDSNAQRVRARARIEAVADYNAPGHRVLIPILENLTTKNKKSNGEKEFHNVFKKMLPESHGELIIGDIEAGDVIEYDVTYTFEGDYRLPSNALDPINHSTEHSVENFNDLNVVLFVQSLTDKEIYQGAVGVREYSEANMDRDWGAERIWPVGLAEFNHGKGAAVYPNPANSELFIESPTEDMVSEVRILDINGREVLSSQAVESSRLSLPLHTLSEGVYVVEYFLGSNLHHSPLVVQH